MPMLTAARSYLADGLSVIPLRVVESKRASVPWKEYQSRCMEDMEATAVFAAGDCGIAVVCGKVSGNLEVLDFDKPGIVDDWLSLLSDVNPELFEIVSEARQIETQSGGRHIYLARIGCAQAGRELATSAVKFAKANKLSTVMIETRGEGQYVAAPPTRGYIMHDGKIPRLSDGDWAILDSVSLSFNTALERGYQAHQQGTALQPGRDFQARGPSIATLLEKHGWTRKGANVVRPGKSPKDGISATIGKVTDLDGNECLYNFTSDGAPFEERKSYNRFAVYTYLEHAGDFHSAARSLAAEGYGDKRPARATHDAPATSMLSGASSLTTQIDPTKSLFSQDGRGAGIKLSDKLPEQRYLFETVWHSNFGSNDEPYGVLPKSLVGMLAAEGGAGKTWALIQLAISVASGMDWLESYRMREVGDVFLGLAEEDAVNVERRIQGGARAIGMSEEVFATMRPRIDVQALAGKQLNLISRGGFTQRWVDLRARLSEREWSLIVLDPLTRWGGQDVETDPTIATDFVGLLEDLCTLPGKPTVLLAHHTAKSSRGGVRTTSASARGTAALSDGPRWHANLEALRVYDKAPHLAVLRVVKANASVPIPPVTLRRDLTNGGALVKANQYEVQRYDQVAKEEAGKER